VAEQRRRLGKLQADRRALGVVLVVAICAAAGVDKVGH
jgi:hypothetical protein